MIKVGVYGATGYTGLELIALLKGHPEAQVVFATSSRYPGQRLSAVAPGAPDLLLVSAEEAPLEATDIVFLCLPHAAAAGTAVAALAAGKRVVDLSADFRLKDAAVYEQWYGVSHPAPDLLPEAVYGLTEFARPALQDTRLVANPGCYTTASLLALQPILSSTVGIAGDIIIDAKSGVSGAGRAPKQHTHFVEVADNFTPYSIGRAHRHLPEMEQAAAWWRDNPPRLIFSPHLLPVPRGILANVYVPLAPGWQEKDIRALYSATYAGETFVQVLDAGSLATLAHVTHTNRCILSLTFAADTLIITSAIDNLQKGAAGQAVQNMNVLLGRPEEMGLS